LGSSARVVIGVAVIIDQGQVVVTRRHRGAHLELLDEFPGGHVEPGETIEECVRREAGEETGLGVETAGTITTVDHRYPDRQVEIHFVRCRLRDERPEKFPVDSHGARWVDLDRLADLRFPAANAAVLNRLADRRTADPSP